MISVLNLIPYLDSEWVFVVVVVVVVVLVFF
jgi:hypothetical protein